MVSTLLDRLTHARMTTAQARDTAAQIKVIEAATFTARSLVYYEFLSELPDHVKNHPLRAQRAFLNTYNNVLKRWGDYGVAMRAADKALRSVARQMREKSAPALPGVDTDVIEFHAKRMLQGPRAQIVAP
jgi:hypothetical protein